jgi:hypothetical protein
VGQRERKRSGRACERNDADRAGPLGSERERGREGARRLAPTRGTRLSSTEGARARAREARLNGLTGLKWVFSISREFLMPFLFIFSLGFSIQIQTKFQI